MLPHEVPESKKLNPQGLKELRRGGSKVFLKGRPQGKAESQRKEVRDLDYGRGQRQMAGWLGRANQRSRNEPLSVSTTFLPAPPPPEDSRWADR